MTKYQKRQTSTVAGASEIPIPEMSATETPIEPTTDGELSNLDSDLIDEQPDLSTSQTLLNTVKARNTKALDELRKQMDDLRDDFVDQAVSIVENGFKDCFFRASQRIRRLQLDWTTTDGNELGETINTIALPSSTTDGDDE